ncbi:MAG: endopeptidase La [Spirochaetaceae bacterium]|jgi:ATP-dependent Lon protease|nr:endopeptidase La [Spirochaetaceae bacterium]
MNLLSVLKGNVKEKSKDRTSGAGEDFPLLPLRELVLFPHTTTPMFITYKLGMAAVSEALRRDMRLFAACLKVQEGGETYPSGSVMCIVQHLRLPDHTFRVVLRGEYRATIASSSKQHDLALVRVEPIPGGEADPLSSETIALMRSVQKSFVQYGEFTKKVGTETFAAVEKAETPEQLANLICNALILKVERKIVLLSMEDPRGRLETILETLEKENEIFGIQRTISAQVKIRMEKNQREYVLHEQLKEIHKELGRDQGEDDLRELEKAIELKAPREEVLHKARKELVRLRKLQPLSPEAGILRGYLEWIAELPWNEASQDAGDLREAKAILDANHLALQKPKERILEFIAVHHLMALDQEQLPPRGKAPILCFVGPPGTGKTSLGKSVAQALGRRFVRISLGGLRDEAEIRGHRKTYVGALPGKILQALRRAGTVNPVLLLDEIDKLASDFRGDPAAALLEVLDPEQNSTFTDHYLELSYDLSQVLFITTANSLHTLAYPLLDRMEIIEIPGYGEHEKLPMAQRFLLPKVRTEHGLDRAQIAFTDEAVRAIIRYWTMESGVRGLERELARCIRRIARDALEQGYGTQEKPLPSFARTVDRDALETLLGRRKYKPELLFKETHLGVCYGLAWTETGGVLLPVETSCFEGTGELLITGNVGEVMKESGSIAVSYLRSVQDRYAFKEDLGKSNFHVHVPEGAIPKDGPSAGITLAVSLFSALYHRPPQPGFAMTGELTLTGRVLPIGGLKEKLLAALRNGMEQVVLPQDNEEDWADLDQELKAALQVHFVETAPAVFTLLFPSPAVEV